MLRTFVEETGCGLLLVSHLRRPDGKGHEEGAATSLSQLRGSHAIAQLSDIVIGLERNQQGENPNETLIRVLKNRFSGNTGFGGTMVFSKETGRLTEAFSQETSPFGEF
jgi:twinkle protein